MKIYTKTGDTGTTALLARGRVSKGAVRVEAYGTVDEANSWLGVVRAHLEDEQIDEVLGQVQHTLFDLGADLATPHDSRSRDKIAVIDEEDVGRLEEWIDLFEGELPQLRKFILPGGNVPAAHLQVARTVVRRAERVVVRLMADEPTNEQALVYLNRLSDLLFVLARVVNGRQGVDEVRWQVKERK